MTEKRSNLRWWIFGISLAISVVFLVYLLIGGSVDGEEFSPDDFSRRRFSYNIMPFSNFCIKGIEYRDKTPLFEQTLLGDGYLGKNAANVGTNQQWHLIYDSGSDPESRDFDAKFLIRFLDLFNDEHESIWIKWNEDHPDLATEFWPIVADMARNYSYVDLTEIMARAKTVSVERADEFKNYMNSHASAAFGRLADQRKADGQHQSALELYEKSLKLSPSAQAANGKAECLAALGKSEATDSELPAEFEEE